MVDLYVAKGFGKEEAKEMLTIMGNHKEFFIDHMMVQVFVFGCVAPVLLTPVCRSLEFSLWMKKTPMLR